MSDDKLESANLPVVDRTINGTKYSITRLGWWDMMDALERLEAVLGPAISDFFRTGDLSVDALMDTDEGKLAPVVMGLVRRVAGEKGRELQAILGKQTFVHPGGKRRVRLEELAMDVWFSQKPEDALLWMAECLKVQFQDFLMRPMQAAGFGKSTKPTVQQ